MVYPAEIGRSSLRGRLMSAFGFGPKRRHVAVPEGMRVYAIGDIHGCYDALCRLHQLILADAEDYSGDKIVVYLGDYIDRGPASKDVVDALVRGALSGFAAYHVKGNHDQTLLDFLREPESYRAWRGYGAPETLLSYGVKPPLFDVAEKFVEARDALQMAMPAAHLKFFRTLEPMVSFGDYAFVHAGIRPGLDLESQTEQDLLWIREDFLSCSQSFEKVIVHGHTPAERPIRLHNRIGLDTGTYATGILSCAVLEGAGCRFIQSRDVAARSVA